LDGSFDKEERKWLEKLHKTFQPLLFWTALSTPLPRAERIPRARVSALVVLDGSFDWTLGLATNEANTNAFQPLLFWTALSTFGKAR